MKNRLFSLNRAIITAGILLFSFSCEKVIIIPIDEEAGVYIIEGVLKDRDSTSFFKVSKSVNIYSELTHEDISNVLITVTDENSNSWDFTEDPGEAGLYLNHNFACVENMTYNLTMNIEGHKVTSSSFTKMKPILDSIYTKPNTLDFEEPISQWVFYHSTDRENEQNNYRLRIWVNGDEPDQYYIGNDFYINGETYEAQFFLADAFPGDSVRVEMLEMDPEVYSYIYGLQNTLTTGAFSPAPANPPSNLNCESTIVHGYFGAFTSQVDSMVVQ